VTAVAACDESLTDTARCCPFIAGMPTLSRRYRRQMLFSIEADARSQITALSRVDAQAQS
jgi:hypothetical protein